MTPNWKNSSRQSPVKKMKWYSNMPWVWESMSVRMRKLPCKGKTWPISLITALLKC